MSTLFTRFLTVAAFAVAWHCLVPAADAQTSHDAPATVDGTWNVSMIGDHVVPVALVLEQQGTRVTGTLMIHGRDVSVRGAFVEGALTIEAAAETADGVAHGMGPLTITGKMKADGTLSGEVTGSRGTIPMTAERLKKRG